MLNENDVLSGNLDAEFRVDDCTNSEFASVVKKYDPQNEVVLLIKRPNCNQDCLRVSTPYPTGEVLMRIHGCVAATDGSRRAYLSDKLFVFEELQSSVDSGKR